LWTLSQISYSREILLKAKLNQSSSPPKNQQDLEDLGIQKKIARIDSLQRMKILKKKNQGWALTSLGKFIALNLKILLWLPNLRDRG
jgi:hypothetical protein